MNIQLQNTIQVFEYGWLTVGHRYECIQTGKEIEFKKQHLDTLSRYLTYTKACPYYSLYFNRVRFCNYVGVIKVGNLTIEVLPKADKNNEDKKIWQNVLLQMLSISLKVKARTTTNANILIRKQSLLETYLHYFMDETESLLHQGLTKKYRKTEGNLTTLKGKLLINDQISKNIVHAERFFASYQVYDRNNIYNGILQETLKCIYLINTSESISKRCSSLLLNFPECAKLKFTEKLFHRLKYDRKTERYKKAIELARIIILNYHPDIKGGSNHILAIMFDMNLLWETYIYHSLQKAAVNRGNQELVSPQAQKPFWKNKTANRNLRLKPDIVIRKPNANNGESAVVIDTKWKYESGVSSQDIRQMYAYGRYFGALNNYLLYPGNLCDKEKVKIQEGNFYCPEQSSLDDLSCGIMFVDLLSEEKLNSKIGEQILERCFAH